jgi:inorganic triphosphatase YgiF
MHYTHGVAIERELRYLCADDFQAPGQLAGLSLVKQVTNHHRDHYFDAAGERGQPLLASADCSLRIRIRQEGQMLVTFKRRLFAHGARAEREELEDVLAQTPLGVEQQFVETVRQYNSPALQAARTISGQQPLVFLFAIDNARLDTHYASDHGSVILSHDRLIYPDGSTEHRLEVELVSGEISLLDRIAVEFDEHYGLFAVDSDKVTEGARRFRALLG